MIIDLQNFIRKEKPYWSELEEIVGNLEAEPMSTLGLEEVKRLHYLYERTSADLGRVSTFASEPQILRYLENLVARSYGEIYEVREKPHRFEPKEWIFRTFPQAFRRHIAAFWVALAATLLGCAFGGGAILLDPSSKSVLMPFEQSAGKPARKGKKGRERPERQFGGSEGQFFDFFNDA